MQINDTYHIRPILQFLSNFYLLSALRFHYIWFQQNIIHIYRYYLILIFKRILNHFIHRPSTGTYNIRRQHNPLCRLNILFIPLSVIHTRSRIKPQTHYIQSIINSHSIAILFIYEVFMYFKYAWLKFHICLLQSQCKAAKKQNKIQ